MLVKCKKTTGQYHTVQILDSTADYTKVLKSGLLHVHYRTVCSLLHFTSYPLKSERVENVTIGCSSPFEIPSTTVPAQTESLGK